MKKIILPGIVLMPCVVFGATDCRVVEYPDHYEAVCIGTTEQVPVSNRPGQAGEGAQEQTSAAARESEQQQTADVPPEMIVRNDLAKLHGASWLKTMSRQ
ncbi:hypothetical protein F6V30_09825 [Oryzomonas sagensis]|uniref:Secreted protein n=1 Tax=Oryzomonas sagensis TaxID=2603857 RepID=A0ABQ6TP53_9BACT|nr:hypothetical protein [Oryzomonas sagensis]KAB0670437.1 hypothetical protein F6V30_09825 [Oryzomonas sagensis]